ncbi:MAG: DNA gyrase inhibitor YacG [Succinivibrio sp.]|nr:DNA gyrase inhibitor YacG [Succinivibrio sp.]
MSLKDLLTPELYDEVVHDAHDSGVEILEKEGQPLKVKCPICKKETVYDASNPFRPFCSEKCRLIDLGAWASDERVIKGRPVDEDEDGELLNDPNLRKYNFPKE